jgi:hypothetical protein
MAPEGGLSAPARPKLNAVHDKVMAAERALVGGFLEPIPF